MRATELVGRIERVDEYGAVAGTGALQETLCNNLGALAFWGFAVVVPTSYLRPKLGYRPWKKPHSTAYLAAASMFVHGALIDQNLKNGAPDLLDEKVLVAGCFLVVVAAFLWRRRRGTEKQRRKAAAFAKAAQGEVR
jgi:DMSO/TMAO reductase YedYZ heme-binding membrane subunit